MSSCEWADVSGDPSNMTAFAAAGCSAWMSLVVWARSNVDGRIVPRDRFKRNDSIMTACLMDEGRCLLKDGEYLCRKRGLDSAQ